MEMLQQALDHLPMLVFFVIGTIAVASSILVVAMRNPVHSALFLLLTFICVAVIFFLVHAEFVGAVQILVYAGGIMVLFLFVVMLINVRTLPEEAMISPFWKGAIGVSLALFVFFTAVVRPGSFAAPVDNPKALQSTEVTRMRKVTTKSGKKVRKLTTKVVAAGNSEAIGMMLYREYLVPFEVASIFLLVAMIGAIIIGKRNLLSDDEDVNPAFITDRAAEEKRVKEASDA